RPAYAASKAAVNAICRHVASKWGKQGIRCNAIAPGLVMTEQLEQNLDQRTRDWMLKGSRSNRHGAPADIAGAAAFLFSDDGEWVNGQTWHVNGGVSLASRFHGLANRRQEPGASSAVDHTMIAGQSQCTESR
ncbi:MAG: SDR family oxidoreductase, partial [Rhodospirillales bacterium]